MKNISLEQLLEAGCHFGHQVSRQNSKAKEFIFEARDNVHIIDLEKTKEGLEDAAKFVQDIAKKNGSMLVLGTKRQAVNVIVEEKKRLGEELADVSFVTKRWIGGTLTNHSEVAKNFKKLKDLTARLKDPKERAKYTKKEMSGWDKSRVKLDGFYGGIQDMEKLPDFLFIIDTHEEHVAAGEALKAGIPTVGITDTNADPTIISYPIPANDDAVGSLQLIIAYIFDAWVEGKKKAESNSVDENTKAATSNVTGDKEVKAKEEKKSEIKTHDKKPVKESTAEKKTASSKKKEK